MEEIKSDNAKVEAPVKEPVVEIDFLARMVEPHEKVSREVTKEDLMKVVDEAKVMYNLCFTLSGNFMGGYAVAHSQIDDKDPLRFFVTHKKEIIINPKMIRHTNHPVDSREGCLSFPHLPVKTVERFHRSEWEYQGIKEDATDLTPIAIMELSGPESKVWQHEVDHLNGISIYPITMGEKYMERDAEEMRRKMDIINKERQLGKSSLLDNELENGKANI